MSEKKYIYRPRAPYSKLKEAEGAIKESKTIDQLRNAVAKHGPRVGYKAFCYIFMNKMTPEAMKPNDAAEIALRLAHEGKIEEAIEIQERIGEWHPDHRVVKQTLEQLDASDETLPAWIQESLSDFG